MVEGEIGCPATCIRNAQDDIRLPLRMVDMDRLTSNKVTLGASASFHLPRRTEAVGNAIGVHVEYVEPLGEIAFEMSFGSNARAHIVATTKTIEK